MAAKPGTGRVTKQLPTGRPATKKEVMPKLVGSTSKKELMPKVAKSKAPTTKGRYTTTYNTKGKPIAVKDNKTGLSGGTAYTPGLKGGKNTR